MDVRPSTVVLQCFFILEQPHIGGTMYIDAHTHLEQFEDNLHVALDIIKKEKILTLACSMDAESYEFSKAVSKDWELVIPAFGIHPWKASENLNVLEDYDSLIREAACIGEIGLDFYWDKNKENYLAQYKVFEYMLDRCKKYGKVSNIHTKGAEKEVLSSIKSFDIKPPIIHWYSGPKDILTKLIDFGCSFTISVDAGISPAAGELIDYVPLKQILTETDGPGSLLCVNGKYGYPDEVKNIVKEVAEIKKKDVAEMTEIIEENFYEKLNIDFKEREEV
jgi:TatD DNase family protein